MAAKTRGGETAIRAYQPVVKNPNTKAQVKARAAFSLMSKTAAQLAGVIMLNADRQETQRNAFIRVNRPFVSFTEATTADGTRQVAVINASNVMLTQGVQDITSDLSFAAVTGQTDKLKIVDAYAGDDKAALVVAYFEYDMEGVGLSVKTYVFDDNTVDAVIDSPAATRSTSLVLAYRVTFADESSAAAYGRLLGENLGEGLTIKVWGEIISSATGLVPSATAHITPSIV